MLLRAVDVLDIYVEPFIHSGFRLPNQPYSYYYRSLFSLHNETCSIWIHLVGTLILAGQVFQHISQLSTNSYSPIIYIYIIYNCIGACIMLLCSAQAHLFHSRTVADHLRSFYLDYFGINFYGFISGIILYRFSHLQKFSVEQNENDVRVAFDHLKS
jgi:predicted membrane channel-forming protein YqfA (hemolysin III family)